MTAHSDDLPSRGTNIGSTASAAVSVQPGGPVEGEIRPPGSKSLTNRALICAAMASKPCLLTGALRSEDTVVMIEGLRECGITIEVGEAGRTLKVDGSKRNTEDGRLRELFIANSGTTVRFLTAALSAAGGDYQLHGVPRMHERPIKDLVEALSMVQRGSITTLSPNGCPPVSIQSQGWSSQPIRVAGNVSSQYLSGLMMAAPIALAESGSESVVIIEVFGELVSRPYVDMTAAIMRDFGVQVDVIDIYSDSVNDVTVRVEVRGNGYEGIEYEIEPDASAASYFWAAAAITGGEVTVNGLSPNALQGDVGFCDVLEKMGCRFDVTSNGMTISGRASRGIDVDMNAISDTVQTLSVVALFAQGATRVRGVAHNRFKETDRIGDLACELRKLGARVEEHDDGLTIHPPESGVQPATLETYHDHRMALSLSLAGLAADGVRVLDPSCTGKTYPDFFADLQQLTGRAHVWG